MKRLFGKNLIAVFVCICMMCSCVSAFAIETEVFSSYGDFEYSVSDGEITITKCREDAMGEIIIPQSIESMPVTAIGESAFEFCTEITKVTIPDTVKTIGSFAFVYCWSLENIDIPDSVISIESSVFEGCTSLKSISIGKGLKSLGIYAFTGCDMLESISVSEDNGDFASLDGVLYSKDGKKLIAYPANKSENVEVAEGVEQIGVSAFGYCTNIETVTLPEGLKTIETYAFNGCKALSSIQFPKTLEYIGDLAFRDCTSLAKITVPGSVTEIGINAFFGCNMLENAVFEGSAPTMGEGVFDNAAETFVITYDLSFASSWAPNGEASFMGYPLTSISNAASATALELKEDSTLTVNNGMLMGVNGNTSVNELLEQFTATGGVSVIDKNGAAVDASYTVGTGYKVVLTVDGEEKESLIIIVTGDVTTDGKVNSRDIASLQRHITEVTLLTDAALFAGDINGDEDINSRDLARVQRIVAS